MPPSRAPLQPPARPASAKKPLNQVQVFALLAGQVPSHRVTMLVQERGIDFEPTDDGRTWVHTFVGVSSLTVCERVVLNNRMGRI